MKPSFSNKNHVTSMRQTNKQAKKLSRRRIEQVENQVVKESGISAFGLAAEFQLLAGWLVGWLVCWFGMCFGQWECWNVCELKNI